MDERRLRHFLAVVEEGGITRAAGRLHIAQPSLSQSLRLLEAELGAQLFIRVGRRVRLSATGEKFVGPARQALRSINEARDVIAEVAELRAGTLEIAALATLTVDPMATLVGRFRESHPGIQVRIAEPPSAGQISSLVRDGSYELGAAHLPLSDDGLVRHPLGEQELLFILPPFTALRDEGPIRAPELAETPLVVSPPDTSTRILLEQALTGMRVTPHIAVEVAAREAIVPLVLAGAGAALLPASLARQAERRGAIVRGARPAITRKVGLIHRRAPLSAAARAFLESATAPGSMRPS